MSLQRRVSSRGAVTWRARVYSHGRIVATETFARKGDASAWEREQYRRLERGDTLIDKSAAALDVKTWAERWLEGYTPRAPATKRRAASLIAVDIISAFGGLSVSSLSVSEVREWVTKLTLEKSPSTARNALGTLRQVLDLALDSHAVSSNVARARGTSVHGVRPGLPRALSADQVAAVAKQLEPRPKDRALFLLLCFTGLRWGEATSVRWCDVADEGKTLVVWRARRLGAAGEGREYGDTKTHAARVVPIPTIVYDALVTWWLSADGHGPDARAHSANDPHQGPSSYTAQWTESKELIFPSRRGNPLIGNTWTEWVLDPACEAAGVGHTTPHQLRDTYASLAVSVGASVAAVAGNLGHSTSTTTLRHYVTAIPEERRSVAVALDQVATKATKTLSRTTRRPDQTGQRRENSNNNNEK